jgi:hypothetical protein
MGPGRTVVAAQARVRWALVLAVVVVLCAVPVVLNLRPAHAAEVDPATLISRIAASRSQPYQGYAQSTGLLPLPALRNLEDVSALVSTTTEMRTWYAAEDSWRVDVVNGGTERDLYQTPGYQYIWDYGDNQLARIAGEQPVRLPRAADLIPPALVHTLLSLAGGERFEPLAGARVAGLDAAGLRIVPTTADTTVAFIDIWADPASGLPVQAEVTAKGGTRPVFRSRFLELHFSTPEAKVLTPPVANPSVGYTENRGLDVLTLINRRGAVGLPTRLGGLARRDAVAQVTAAGIYGSGLDQLVVVALPGRLGGQAYDQISAYGTPVVVPGAEASVLGTGLLSVLAVRGRRTFLVAGLVTPAALQKVAADLAGAAS